MNRGGWLRIVEASVSILIIFGVIFAIYIKQPADNEVNLNELARSVLEEISQNNSLRYEILSGNQGSLNGVIESKIIDQRIMFEAKICEIGDACGKSEYTEGNVYSAERVISSSVQYSNFNPKKVRLFLWIR